MSLVVIVDPAGEVVDVVDDAEPGCGGTWGFDPPCGGCVACMIAQAHYAGYPAHAVEPRAEQRETIGDAVGRTAREVAQQHPRAPMPEQEDAERLRIADVGFDGVAVVRATPKAMLVDLGEKLGERWVPHSCVHDNSEVYVDEGTQRVEGSPGKLVVKGWFAAKEGLV